MNLRGKKILLADDDPQIQTLLKAFLEKRGFVVEVVSDGSLCLDAILKFRPDLLLLDINMPKMDGMETLAAIKVFQRTHELPIIIVSAQGGMQNVLKGAGLGADDFMVKPFALDALEERIGLHLFRMDEGAVSAVLANLNAPLAAHTKSKQLVKFKENGYNMYSATYEKRELCVFLSKHISPDHTDVLSNAQLKQHVLIFIQHTKSWKQVWPSEATPALPKVG